MMLSCTYLLYMGLWVTGGNADDQRPLIGAKTEGFYAPGYPRGLWEEDPTLTTAAHSQQSLLEAIVAFRAINELEYDVNTTSVYSVAMHAERVVTEATERIIEVILPFRAVSEYPANMVLQHDTLEVIISREHIIKTRGSRSSNLTAIDQLEVNLTVGNADTEHSEQPAELNSSRMENKKLFTLLRSRRSAYRCSFSPMFPHYFL